MYLGGGGGKIQSSLKETSLETTRDMYLRIIKKEGRKKLKTKDWKTSSNSID